MGDWGGVWFIRIGWVVCVEICMIDFERDEV